MRHGIEVIVRGLAALAILLTVLVAPLMAQDAPAAGSSPVTQDTPAADTSAVQDAPAAGTPPAPDAPAAGTPPAASDAPDAALGRLIFGGAGPNGPRAAAAPPTTETREVLGTRIVDGVTGALKSLATLVRQDGYALRATWRRLGGLAQIDARAAFGLLPGLALVLGASLVAGGVAHLAARPMFRRIGRSAVRGGLLRKAGLACTGILLDLLTVLVGALAGGLVMSATTGSGAADDPHQIAALDAFIVAGVLSVAIRAVLSPSSRELRPLPIGGATARAWNRHLTLIVVIVVFGEMLAGPLITEIASPITGRAAVVACYLVALVYLIMLVIRHRAGPAAYFRGRAEKDPDDTALALLAAIMPWWHIPVLAYLLFLLHEAMTSGRSGLPVLIASGRLAAAFALGLLAVALLNRMADRGVSLSAGMNRAFPTTEERLNGFAPGFLRALRYVVLIVWLGYALQSVGTVPVWAWVEGRFGIDVFGIATSLVIIVLVGFVAWLVLASWIDHRLAPAHGELPTSRQQTLLALLRNVGLIAILLTGTGYALAQLGVSVAPLLASAGVIGLAISWGSQKLVQDIITGIFIQFENAINVGDVVELGGKIGTVEKLTIRSVSLRDVEGVFHMVPFSSVDLVSNHMKGYSYHVADIGVAYREDIDAAKAEMLAAYDDMAADLAWSTKLVGGIEWFGVEALADSAVVLRARIKTRPGEQWAVGRAYTEAVKKRLDAAGIEIPFPHLTLWFGADREGAAPPAHLELGRSHRKPAHRPAPAPAPGAQSVRADGPTDADYGEDD